MNSMNTPATAALDTRPILLLNVDGVINAIQDPANPADGYVKTMYSEQTWTVHDPAVLDRLRRLHDSGNIDIRWLTTWPESPLARMITALRLPAWHTAGSLPLPYRPGWKSDAARRVCENEPNRPLIWVDDDLQHQFSCGEMGGFNDRRPEMVFISPNPYHGLLDEHLDYIEAYVGALAEESTAAPAPAGLRREPR
jgi:hypothetical protein